MIETQLTFEEIEYLFNHTDDPIYIEYPFGYTKINAVYSKYMEGNKLYLDDNTSITCAESHYMLVDNEWKNSNEIKVNDYLTDKYGKKSKKVIKKEKVPVQKWIDFEVDNEYEMYVQNGVIHHNSGKSAAIYGITSFLVNKGLKGLILVPSVSLTTQLYNDFKDYNAPESFLENIRLIGGDNNEKILDKKLTISTWQSMMRVDSELLKTLDFIVVDEAHGLKYDTKASDIVYKSINAKYRIGLTGTLPEDPLAKMSIMACTGKPKRFVRTQDLIERNLATPVHINVIRLVYSNEDKALFRYVGNYAKQLKFIKEHKPRNELIAKLSNKVTENGNTVILCQHIQHMQDIFTELIKLKDPNIKIEKKHLTGKNALEFQESMKIFYVAGATKSKDRDKIFNILRNHTNCIVISNYQLMSTGLNIKSLKNIVFASPLKSYTTITQSLGRAIRKHVSKNTAEIYDFVDDFSARGRSGQFYRQYLNRLRLSYEPEGFPITERTVLLRSMN